MDESNSLISIIIPNYNNAKYLERTIDSAILASKKYNVEIIFVDDCSSDESVSIAESYGKELAIYKNENNLGQEITTNLGLTYSKGKYAVILHSDDLLSQDFFSVLLPLMENNHNVVMAVGERVEIDENDVVLFPCTPFYDNDYFIKGKEQAKIFLLSSFLPCQVLFKKAAVLEFGGAQPHYNINLDGLLWFKLCFYGDVAYTQKTVCFYRRHSDSVTSREKNTLQHLFEYYSTVKQMFIFSQTKGYDFSVEKDRAFTRIAELALRYAREINSHDNILLVQRFVMFAKAIKPTINSVQILRELKIGRGQQNGKIYFHNRTISYKPPVGSRRISTETFWE